MTKTWQLFARLHHLFRANSGDDYKMSRRSGHGTSTAGTSRPAGGRTVIRITRPCCRTARQGAERMDSADVTHACERLQCTSCRRSADAPLNATPFGQEFPDRSADVRALPSPRAAYWVDPGGAALGGAPARYAPDAARQLVSGVPNAATCGAVQRAALFARDSAGLALRLKLILRQALQYQHMYALSPDLEGHGGGDRATEAPKANSEESGARAGIEQRHTDFQSFNRAHPAQYAPSKKPPKYVAFCPL